MMLLAGIAFIARKWDEPWKRLIVIKTDSPQVLGPSGFGATYNQLCQLAYISLNAEKVLRN